MKDFADIDFITGTFPDVVAKDSSGPTVRDGTPLVADWLSELFGVFQGILEFAGKSPDGVTEGATGMPETSTGSQVLSSLRLALSMPGEVIYFAGRDPDPATHSGRLLELAGQGVLIADYPDLVGVTYCGDANNATASSFYKVDDPLVAPPVRNTAGLYMMLPDCRGKFIRALNGTAPLPVDEARDSSGENDEPGSSQLSQAGEHDHPVGWKDGTTVRVLNNDSYWVATAFSTGLTEIDILTRQGTAITNGTTEGFGKSTDRMIGGIVPADEETRPYNIAFYAMIRY